jgi:hypothetical protein
MRAYFRIESWPERRILTSLFGFPIVVVLALLTFGIPAFGEKVAGESEMLWVLSMVVKSKECQFDFRMARISMQLVLFGAKGSVNQVHVFEHDV